MNNRALPEGATVAEAIRGAAQRLAATSDTARLDAEVMMAHALGVTRSQLLLGRMRDPAPDGFAQLVDRRAAHEPVAYITGTQEFYGLDLEVSPAVLIPRGDTETLVDAARDLLAHRPPARILDLGTGSGALLLAALSVWPEAQGWGIDRSVDAIMVAVRNAMRHANTPIGIVGAEPGVVPADLPPPRADRGFARFSLQDWTKRGWSDHLGRFDLVLANPPYVEDEAPLDASVRAFEPAGALFSGPEGLDDYRVLVPQLPRLLAPGGLAVVEIGYRQAAAVAAIGAACGLSAEVRQDLGGRDRAVAFSVTNGIAA